MANRKTQGWRLLGVAFALAAGGAALNCRAAAENGNERSHPHPVSRAAGHHGPPYAFPYKDGLYATVTAESAFKEPDVKTEQKWKLKNIPGFKKDLKVRVMWRKKPAPLVVLLLGMSMPGDDPMARLWQATLYEAGFHVLSFDSVSLPSFNRRSQHGVTGNPGREAEVVGRVIGAFLNLKKTRGQVTRLGIFGASYGGIVALNLARQAAKKKVRFPLPLESVLAYSPPVRLRTTVRLLDRYHARDRPKFQKDKLIELMVWDPVPPGKPIPYSDSLMRAGIAYHFREQLYPLILWNNRQYRLGILEKEAGPLSELAGDFDLENLARTWTFTQFIEKMAFPYWRRHGGPAALASFWAKGSLEKLLRETPDYARVVLARDDPLNDPGEVDRLQETHQRLLGTRLIVHLHGGHLGFISTKWAKACLTHIFNLKEFLKQRAAE